MVESIAATSLLGHRPIYCRCIPKNNLKNMGFHFRRIPTLSISSKRGFSSLSIKAQAMEMTKEAYSYKEKENQNPRDFGYGFESNSGQKMKYWSPTNKADNPSLHNPLLRQERLGCGWLGAIFEFEGVLIEDNPDLEKQAWLALSQEEGKSPPLTFTLKRIEGMKNEQAISEVLCWSRDPTQVRRLASRKEIIYQALQGGIYRYRPGSQEFVNTLINHKIPMALVSTRPRKIIEHAIGEIGIEGVFTVIVTSEDVYRGKPDPEMFVYAAQSLNFIPERCIVFGNSNSTVEAAHDAQMKCVAVASKHPVYELAAANRVVKRLDELSVIDLKNLAAVESGEFEPELEREEEEVETFPVAIDDDFR